MADLLQPAGSKPLSLFAPAQITSMSLIEFLDISPDALVIVDQAGIIVMVNHQIEALFGYSSQELLGQHLELLANMSHELRTPLNSVIGFCEMLYEELVGPLSAKQRSCLSEVLNSSRHLLRLINDVLDLARVESGKIVFEPEPVELKQLIEDVQAILHPLISKKNLHVSLEVAPSVTGVMIDPAKFKQVLYNYLSNAIKFTPENGKICVRILSDSPTTFCLEVEDTGIGIKTEDIERLFIAFQQLDNSTSKQFQGTGLGLALVKHLVEVQGGRVGVESTPEVGSTFFAAFPRIGGKTFVEVVNMCI